METNCLYCGKALSAKQQKRGAKACSYSCSNKWRYRHVKKEFVCRLCGKTYIKKNTGTKIGTKYCSEQCAHTDIFTRKKSEEHRRKIAEGQRHVRREGRFLCDRCGKEFKANTELRAHKAWCGHKRRSFLCVKCGRSFIGKAGLLMHQSFCSKGEWNRNRVMAVRKANIVRLQKGKNKSSGTDIEIEIERALLAVGIKVIRQYRIDDDSWHLYDFYIPEYNLLLEVDGDYWHGRDEQNKTSWFIKQRNTDRIVVEYAQKRGFKVIRFWGSDVKERVSKCIGEIIDYGKGYQRGADWCSRCL